MSGLNKEIWTDILMDKFYPDGSFITASKDMSEFVEHNKIHLAEAGANPDVLVNNTTFPIPVTQRTDTPLEVVLQTLDTTSTVIRNAEQAELSYNKMESVMSGHKAELLAKQVKLAAYAWSPASATANNFILKTDGGVQTGFKKLTFEKVLELKSKFDQLNCPTDGRILVLNPIHSTHLYQQDLTLFRSAMSEGSLFGFKVYASNAGVQYDLVALTKKTFGAVPDSNTVDCSFAYISTEVMRAVGDIDMFYTLKDPDNKGDKVNFQQRFIAASLRNKYMGALISDKA